MLTVNAHKVLHNAPTDDDFLENIELEARKKKSLIQARDLIREHLKQGLRDWDKTITKDQLFEGRSFNHINPPALRPKFRMQGSFSYKTVNDPALQPPQEVDLDDGIFLPIGFLEKNGSASPMVASRGFFQLIESLLAPLCKEKGWVLNGKKMKPSCVRIIIPGGVHIDLPLYAVSDSAFAALVEKRAGQILNDNERTQLQEGLILDEKIYESLDESEIQLAHRDEGWIKSDPRKLEDWFQQAVKSHDEQLRRVSRYLKAWRDYNWPSCKLSSITLMQCTVMAYDELKGKLSPKRDDLALYEVVQKLPEYFAGNIENPVIPEKTLNDNWTPEMRSDYIMKARTFRAKLSKALTEHTPPAEVLRQFKNAFGPRISSNENLVEQETIAEVVRTYDRHQTPQPAVKRSKSG